MTTKKNLLPEVKMRTRTWPNPTLTEAQKKVEEARAVKNRTERIYLTGISDRAAQERTEADIANRARNSGRELELYHVPHAGDTVEILNGMSSHPESTVHRWISDQDLVQRKAALEAAQAELEEAEAEFNRLRETSKPVTEAEIKTAARKIKASYGVNRSTKLAGTFYPAGSPVPDSVIDAVDPWTVIRWETAGLIRRFTNG